MRDLLLYRLLSNRRFVEADTSAEGEPPLVDLLREAANELTGVARVPFFAGALDVLEEKDVAVETKRQALRVLTGATGLLALAAFLRALDEPELMPDAVEALRHVANEQPNRWIHVAFHPNEQVRRLGYAKPRPSGTAIFDLSVLGDPVARPGVIQQIRALGAEKTMTLGAWPTLVDAVRAGHLPLDLAEEMLSQTVSMLTSAHTQLRARSTAGQTAFIEALKGPARPEVLPVEVDPDSDDLDVIFKCLGPALKKKPALLNPLLLALNPCRLRAAGAAWRTLLSIEDPCPALAAAAVLLAPATLSSPHLNRELLRSAFYDVIRLSYFLDAASVEQQAKAGAFNHPDGGLDLGLVNVIYARLPDGFSIAFKQFGQPAIVSALVARTEESLGIVLFPNGIKDKHELHTLFADLGGVTSRVGARVLAAFLEHAPAAHLQLGATLPGLKDALPIAAKGLTTDTRRAEVAAILVKERGKPLLEELVLPLLATPSIVGESPSQPTTGGAYELGRALLVELAATLTDVSEFISRLVELSIDDLLRVLGALNGAIGFPMGKELALAYALANFSHPDIRAWADARLPRPVDGPAKRPRQGVAYKTLSSPLSVKDCVLLLGSADPIDATDAALSRLNEPTPAFLRELDVAMVSAFSATPHDPLSPLGHAWLWRWDAHALAHLDLLLLEHGTLANGIAARANLKTPWLRDVVFQAIANALSVLAAREEERFRSLANDEFAAALVEQLATPAGARVADMLVLVHTKAEIDRSRLVARLREKVPALDQTVRDRLARIIDSSGLLDARKVMKPAPREDEADAMKRLVQQIRRATSVEAIAPHLGDTRRQVVEEAVLGLAGLGEPGRHVLADRLEAEASTSDDSFLLRSVVTSVPLWDGGPALGRIEALTQSATAKRSVVFRLSLALAARGGATSKAYAVRAAAAARSVEEAGWFEQNDFALLVKYAGDAVWVSEQLATAPHPYAYLPALDTLLKAPPSDSVRGALLAFLEQGTERMGAYRRAAAKHLAELGDLSGLCVLMPRGLEDSEGLPLDPASPEELRFAVRSLLAAGATTAKEPTLMTSLSRLPRDRVAPAMAEILEHATTDKARVAAATALSRYESRASKLFAVAKTFLWGARVARKLLGRPIRIRITGSRKLGFTRGDANEIFVSPVPLFTRDPNGRDVVEGLILHELGHHVYHGGAAGRAIWDDAKKLGIHGLFNLVADEHLERNLRAVDASYGDRLKRLASYAFHRTSRDVPINPLVQSLGPRAFDVLSKAELGLAREPNRVRLESGQLLFGMERSGLSFARFARGLRMGLGNRHDDPRVTEALALFGSRFRHATMPELLQVARRLKEIFGWEAEMAESSFGPHEVFEDGLLGEGDSSGEGITQEEIDRVVERFTDPRMLARGSGPGGGRLAINVSEDTKYDLIKHVEHKPFNKADHAALAAKVARPASILRRYLEELGIKNTPRSMRTSGLRIDRSRLRSLVLTSDPRVLITRERAIYRDLFIAVVIDCSGSMQARGNIERAKLFAALVAEAVAPLDSVDARFFGFTDRVIYDCGDSRRPSVHTLHASGGNNDAGALDHVARVAQASCRRAKVIIMVSDGLPTECSVAALKNLVRSLTTRQRFVVAQVAVQPITEICFPHYVLLQDAETDAVVRRFGTLVARLVRGALAS